MTKKVCTKCKQPKDLSEFHKDKSHADGLKFRCKECIREQQLGYLARTGYKKRQLKQDDNVRKLVAYLKEHPCVDCGEDDIIVLEFDHLPEFTKSRDISNMMFNNWSVIMAEIDKCEVCCANCHRRRTAQRAGWKKLLYNMPS